MATFSRSNLLGTALFGLIILVSLNLLGTRFFSRLDLTENRDYTISPSTRQVLERLDDVVSVKAYFSRDLPPYLATLDRQVKDLLDEYQARARAKIEVEFEDPGADPVLERSVQMLGIPKVQLNIIQRDKAEVTGAYLGISVQYGDQTEVIPVVQSINNLEYDLTAAVVKVTSEQKTLGVVGSPELSLGQGLQGMQEMLGRQYLIEPVDLAAGEVPPAVSTLVVVDSPELSELALYRLDQFVMRGGRLLALAPGVDVAMGTLSARDREVKMGPLLRAWGAEVRPGLVADAQAAMATFSQGYMSFTLPYPWWPQVTGEGLSRDNPITATMDALVIPWASPLAPVPVDSAGGVGVAATVLARSSPRSFAATMPYDLSPQSRGLRPPDGGLAPQTLAMALTGRFPSLWRGSRPVPGDSLGTAPRSREVSEETQIVVVGNAQLVEDRYLQQFPANGVFLANALDWMTLGNDLIAIRSRGAATRPLREIEDRPRNLLKTAAIFSMPLLTVIGGLARMRWRKIRRRRDAAIYGGEA